MVTVTATKLSILWTNSWFQLAVLTAIFSGCLLLFDFCRDPGGALYSFHWPLSPQDSKSAPGSELAPYPERAAVYEKAAEQGDVDAARNLGYLYLMDGILGAPPDMDKAFKWIKVAADKDDTFALALQYQYGLGQAKDPIKAISIFEVLAMKGDALAENQLGFSFSKGLGVKEDDTQAVPWLKKAADQGYAPAEYNLGVVYGENAGVTQDFEQEMAWDRKAADQGDAKAENDLGFMYAAGWGAPLDDTQAAIWYKKAADQGLASAQGFLGDLYFNGHGVPQDYTQALYWDQKAADQKLGISQKQIGDMYARGLGVPKDISEAVQWYKKAAANGDLDAPYLLQKLGD